MSIDMEAVRFSLVGGALADVEYMPRVRENRGPEINAVRAPGASGTLIVDNAGHPLFEAEEFSREGEHRQVESSGGRIYIHHCAGTASLDFVDRDGTRTSMTPIDVRKDPDNVANLVDHPDYRHDLDRLRTALRRWQLTVHDAGILSEEETARRADAQQATIYEMVRDPTLYPLESYLDAADLAYYLPAVRNVPKTHGNYEARMREYFEKGKSWDDFGSHIRPEVRQGIEAWKRRQEQ